MRALILAGLALSSLAACTASPEELKKPITVQAMEIGGKPYRCLKTDDLNTSVGNTQDLKGDIRDRLLTDQARNAGVRVFISSTSVNEYGQIVLYYANSTNTCLFFSEGLTLQEYNQRIGLTPVGISPFYEVDRAPAAAPAPAPTPTLTPTPAPKKQPYTKADLDKRVGDFKLRDLLRQDVVDEIEKNG